MAEHISPIVPAFFVIGAQKAPYEAAPITRYQAIYHTQTTVRGQPPTGKPETIQQTNAYCLPDEPAWERVQVAHARLSSTLAALGDGLRKLGTYSQRLKEAGGIKKATNPLTPTVISISDPDTPQQWWFQVLHVPQVERVALDYHTAAMLRESGKEYTGRGQANHTLCPTDADWERIKALHKAAESAYTIWSTLVKELGTYEQALDDDRYAKLAAAPAQPADPTPPAPAAPVPADTWHNLPPALAGWRWTSNKAGETALTAPDGDWSTKTYKYSNKAIAEALRRVQSQPKAPAALIPAEPVAIGVAMMDAAEARATLDGMREDLDGADKHIISFRRRALDFAEREGWRALGYKGSAEAITAELGEQYSKSYVSRLLNAAKIERLLELPMGNSADVPERTLRPLGQLDTPEQQKQAWQVATTAASGAQPTAGQVQQAVDQVRPQQPLDDAARLELSKAGWDVVGAPRQRGSTTLYTFRHGGTFQEQEIAAGEVPFWAAEVKQVAERKAAAAEQPKPTPATGTMHPDYQHLAAIEQILATLDQWADSARPAQIQQAYAHARGIRDHAMHARAFATIDRALEATAEPAPKPETRGQPAAPAKAPEFTSIFDEMHWRISKQDWSGAQALIDRLPGGAVGVRKQLREVLEGVRPTAAPAPAEAAAVLRRPLRPVSADVSAQLRYLDQLEAYTDAQTARIAELEQRLGAPIRWIRIQLATCRLRIVDGTADEVTAAELEQLAEDLEQFADDDSLPTPIYESLTRQIRAAQQDLQVREAAA
jgi:hypothetical protein